MQTPPPAKTSWRACGRPLHPASHLQRHRRRPRSDKLTISIPLRPAIPPIESQQRRVLARGGRARVAMAAGRGLLVLLFSATVVVGFAAAANAPFLSDSMFQPSAGSTGRSLLQATKSCPVNFEFQNYTIITSKCKGPKFPASQCCPALKEFACPFNTYINDESNDCASTMFSYINLYGKYPPGLFSSECREGKQGLYCADVPQRDAATSNGGQHTQSCLLGLSTVLSVAVALLFH